MAGSCRDSAIVYDVAQKRLLEIKFIPFAEEHQCVFGFGFLSVSWR